MKSKRGAWFASLALLITSAASFHLAAQINGNGSGTSQFVPTQSSGDGLVLRDRENAIFWSGTATTEPPSSQQPLNFIAGEVIADFPDGYIIEKACTSVDDTEPEMLDFWAFKRSLERTNEPRR